MKKLAIPISVCKMNNCDIYDTQGAPMDVTKIRRMIGQCTDMNELHQIKIAANKRERDLRKKAIEEGNVVAWTQFIKKKEGFVLIRDKKFISTTVGKRDGRNGWREFITFTKGEVFSIYHIQPRKKRVWINLKRQTPYICSLNVNALRELKAKWYNTELEAQVASHSLD